MKELKKALSLEVCTMSLVVCARTVTRYNHFLWKQNNSISFPLGLLIIDDDRPWARPDLVRSTWLMGEVELRRIYFNFGPIFQWFHGGCGRRCSSWHWATGVNHCLHPPAESEKISGMRPGMAFSRALYGNNVISVSAEVLKVCLVVWDSENSCVHCVSPQWLRWQSCWCIEGIPSLMSKCSSYFFVFFDSNCSMPIGIQQAG